ncbi:hypothetical protein ACODUM_03285 [Stenotrophomonas maltophilia]
MNPAIINLPEIFKARCLSAANIAVLLVGCASLPVEQDSISRRGHEEIQDSLQDDLLSRIEIASHFPSQFHR